VFNPKRQITSRRIKIDFFNVIDRRIPGPRRQLVLERLDADGWTFNHDFNAAVVKILDEAHDLMPGRRALRKEPITDALNAAANEKSPRDSVGHEIVLVQLCKESFDRKYRFSILFTPGLSQVKQHDAESLETV
jgi:hypothetical protein